MSRQNLCVKNATNTHANATKADLNCYLLNIDEPDRSDGDGDSDNEIDNINQYKILDIYPVYGIEDIKSSDFEQKLINDYTTILQTEDQLNEEEITKLLNAVDKQKMVIKSEIFKLHKNLYNITQDIENHTTLLNRTNKLFSNSEGKSDKTLFKLERMIEKLKTHLDFLNTQLSETREKKQMLIIQYWELIEQFNEK